MNGTKEEIEKFLFGHAIIITYGPRTYGEKYANPFIGSNTYPITKVLNELEKAKAPDLRAIYLGPWSTTSSLWMLRRGPEIANERLDAPK